MASLLSVVYNRIVNIFKSTTDNSMSIPKVYDQIWSKIIELPEDRFMWLVDVYVDAPSSNLFAIFARDGSLYRASISMNDASVNIGVLEKVTEIFVPAQNKLIMNSISSRWFLIASSSVLSRSANLHSKKLFDNLVKRCIDTGNYPFLTFFHLDKPFKMGQTDWVGREENLLLASGTFDDSELGNAMKKAYAEAPEYWGASISYYPFKGEMVEVSKDIEIPLYSDGEFYEISILPEREANCLFTALKSNTRKVNLMDQRLIDAIKRLAGGDEDLASKFISLVDSTNGKIMEENLLTLAVPPEVVVEVKVEQVDPVAEVGEVVFEEKEGSTELVENTVVEIDEELMKELVQQSVSHPAMLESIGDLVQKSQASNVDPLVQQLRDEITELRVSNQTLTKKLSDRLEKLEKEDLNKKEEWLSDLPRRSTKVSLHRPKDQVQDSSDEPASLDQIASETLSKIR